MESWLAKTTNGSERETTKVGERKTMMVVENGDVTVGGIFGFLVGRVTAPALKL